MTASASPQPGGVPRPQPETSPAAMLAELESTHAEMRERIAALGAIADNPQPSKMEYTSARLRLSQASIDRRSAVNTILRFLEERRQPGDAPRTASSTPTPSPTSPNGRPRPSPVTGSGIATPPA